MKDIPFYYCVYGPLHLTNLDSSLMTDICAMGRSIAPHSRTKENTSLILQTGFYIDQTIFLGLKRVQGYSLSFELNYRVHLYLEYIYTHKLNNNCIF